MLKELPKKWCIKVGEFNREHPVILYLNKKYGRSHDGSETLYADLNDNSDCWPTNMWNIPEISFDDFKRLVLGETVNNEMIIEIW